MRSLIMLLTHGQLRLYRAFSFYSYVWRCFNIGKQELQINEEIRDKELRIIGSNGEQLGIMSAYQALAKAESMNLDLVKIAPQAKPPVCKIMDYGKYRFEQAKREKEARKNQHVVDVKEIRLSLNIDTHDFNTKLAHAKRFVGAGNKIKVSIRFRGREMGHPELGMDVMKKFAEACADFANIEKPAKLEGRSMLMFLGPKTK
ncbi:MAG: translation initiation factor IF-3 [Candidatus Pseudoruminococcus sp.]|nr:translation initiation factor IF-3 [Ruminococcus sp.]MDY2783419.1 translation initiation factor IF-3 [Candidatus Pseudoruminococcus sp.]